MPKDDQQSAFWYRQAAEQGEWRAQSLLAGKFDGEGVQRTRSKRNSGCCSRIEGRCQRCEFAETLLSEPLHHDSAPKLAAAREWKPKIHVLRLSPSSQSLNWRHHDLVPVRLETTRSTGSGFFATSDRIVTNHHVTDGCTRLTVLASPPG